MCVGLSLDYASKGQNWGGDQGAIHYMGYMDMCGPQGYACLAILIRRAKK